MSAPGLLSRRLSGSSLRLGLFNHGIQEGLGDHRLYASVAVGFYASSLHALVALRCPRGLLRRLFAHVAADGIAEH
jgi:hypothetical protein